MPTSALPPIRIYLLGRFEVARGEKILRAADWSRRKAAALLQRLAFERRLIKDQAVEFLWPESSAAVGANNLYRTLHALRQTLDAALGQGASQVLFSFEDGVLALLDTVWVDVHEFQRLASSNRSEIRDLQSALELYAGDLVPDDVYADWTLVPRESLRRLHREASLALAAHHGGKRDYARAVGLLTPLLARDPADEPVHRELMRAYALTGRRHDALRQYQACVDALAAELDVSPEPQTAALYSQILNGQLAPLPPLSADRVLPAPVALDIQHSPTLVGRDAEFETLLAWINTARQGKGKTILLAGESGIGKTLLAGEALCAATGVGMMPLFGAAYEQEGQWPYQPFIEAFNRYLTDHHRPLEENPITHFKHLGSGDLQQEQWMMFNAVTTFLTDLARRAPVVLLVDDLHAADEASLRLFHYLARQTRAAPVILLATWRADMVVTGSPFATLLNALYRERLSETLTLRPLTKDDVACLLNDLLGGQPASELIATIHDITEGNPFFVQEVARALLKAGQVEMGEGQWRLSRGAELRVPAGLSGLLRERVQRLGPSVEAALTAASVIGREFGYEVLRGVSALPDGALLDALDAALVNHLLEETSAGYRFRHTLIRRALYDALSRTRRARLHTRTAESLAAVYALRLEGLAPHIEDLAFHYDLGDRRDRALDYLIQAGQKAAQVYAFELAVSYFERALSLMDELGLADPARRWMLLESLGWWHVILADTPRAVARFELALALAPGGDWQPARPDRVRLHCGAAVTLITAGDTTAAEAHLRAGLAQVDEQDVEHAAEYADLLYHLAQLHWHRNEYQQAFDVAQRSLAMAERLNNPTAIARAFEMLALACHSLGEWQTGLAFEQQRAALVGSALDVSDAFDVHL